MALPPNGFRAKFKMAGNGAAMSKLFETIAEVSIGRKLLIKA
jgi:hypothetical protein